MVQTCSAGRILFHAKDGGSLGHQNRVLALAEGVVRVDPTTEVLLLTENVPVLIGPQIPFVPLPAVEDVRCGPWTRLGGDILSRITAGVIVDVLQSYQPTLVVYDTLVWRGLQTLVRAYGSAEVLVLRLRKDADEFLARHCGKLLEMERILIPHSLPDWKHVHIPGLLASKMAFVGPILRRSREEADPAGIKQDYGLQQGLPTIVVSGGGGGFTEHAELYRMALEGVHMASGRMPDLLPDYRLILITGPHFRGKLLPNQSNRVIVREFEPRLFDLLAAADLVICQGGYNTLNEVAELGVPTVCLPARRSHDDQAARAKAMSQSRWWIRVIESPTSEAVATGLLELLQRGGDRESTANPATGVSNRDRAAALLAQLAHNSARIGNRPPTHEALVEAALRLPPALFFARW